MDFLRIRKKAKERARAREGAPLPPTDAGVQGAATDGEAPAAEARSEAAPRSPPADPVVTDADVLEGELAARLQGLPAAADERFTTWRPGSGAPPPVKFEPLRPDPQPSEEDFTVISALGVVASPVPPPPTEERRAARAAPQDPLDEFFYRPDEEAPHLPAFGAPAERAIDDADTVAREEYLTFLLGREEYAVAIERVREVMKSPPITEVPRAPAHVLGVVTVRGEVVAVFDPRRRLGLPGTAPEPGHGRVVIVDAGEGPCGLLVDGVASVVRLRPGSIEPRPQGIGGASAECLAGIGRQGDRLFTVLDLGAFLRRAPARRGDEGDRHVDA